MTTSGPIFILGIMQRSGTNWVRDLLLCHPDCYGARIPEDFLLANSHLLIRFGSSLYKSWPETWRADQRVGPQDRLHRVLGDALLEFIGQEPNQEPDGTSPGGQPSSAGRRLVTKTPVVANLENFFTFFPTSQAIILVRDGRAVVESMVQGFGWGYEAATRRWDRAAREILSFLAAGGPGPQRALVVKYEDLYSAPEAELRRMLAFLNLDPARYAFGKALALPVRGSSVFGRESDHQQTAGLLEVARVRPDPESGQQWPARTAEFSPLDRAAHWDGWRQARFNRIAGESLEALGYKKVPPGPRSLFVTARHWLYDAKWSVPRRLLSVGFLLKRALGRSDPDFKDARTEYYVRERHARARPQKTSGAKAPATAG